MRCKIPFIFILLFFGCSSSNEDDYQTTPPDQSIAEYNLIVNAQDGGTVDSSGGTYESGSNVTITAIPSNEYVFSGWSNGSTENPLTITINTNLNITANFSKRQYLLEVNLEGQGTVSETIISSAKSPTNYDSGTVVRLMANPSDEWLFNRWSGSVSSTSNPIDLTIDEAKTITAYFEYDCELRKITPQNFNNPSYATGVFYDLESSEVDNIIDMVCHQEILVQYILLDYNFDGYLDMIYAPNDYFSPDNRQQIQFYTGNCDNEFNPDENNNNRFLGLVHSRKILLGDYNSDNYVDVLFIGHGWDHDDYPGEYPVLLKGSANGIFSEERLTEFSGYNHGGTSGDFDNDGDLDIILNTTRLGDSQFTYLVNDGNGNFSSSDNIGVFSDPFIGAYVNSEFYDINNDGNLDLFLMNEIEMDDMDGVIGRDYYSELLLGNGNDFTGDRIQIPRVLESTSASPFYTVYDIDFFDLDSDGVDEIIVNRTTENYRGWYIQIVKFQNNDLIDVTDTFISNNRSPSDNEQFISYLEIREISGVVTLRTGRTKNCDVNDNSANFPNFYSWNLIGTQLIRN